MNITRSQEEYLEALLLLQKQEPVVRVRDLAKFLNVTMPSVTGMLRTLASKGLVEYKPYGYALLSDRGRKIAEGLFKKHNDLKEFLSYILGLSEKESESSACSLEHSLSEKARQRLATFVRFIKECPRCGDDLLSHFRQFEPAECMRVEQCEKCLQSCSAAAGETSQ